MKKATSKEKSGLFLFIVFTALVSLLQLSLVTAPAQAASYAAIDAALSINTISLPDGEVGVFYSQNLTASGGGGTYQWWLSSGSLPTGLSLSPGGVISGTPTATGTSNFSVTVNSLGTETTKSLSITINPATTQSSTTSIITITTQVTPPTVTYTSTQPVVQQTRPSWIYAVIVVDAVLIIAVIALVIRTRRTS